jgi:hypothetical protein
MMQSINPVAQYVRDTFQKPEAQAAPDPEPEIQTFCEYGQSAEALMAERPRADSAIRVVWKPKHKSCLDFPHSPGERLVHGLVHAAAAMSRQDAVIDRLRRSNYSVCYLETQGNTAEFAHDFAVFLQYEDQRFGNSERLGEFPAPVFEGPIVLKYRIEDVIDRDFVSFATGANYDS